MTVCPFATWRPVRNKGGPMSTHLGLILHVQAGNNGLSGWFNNPASSASSTWWVSKGGALEQYVDADVVAWAQGAGNSTYNSVETEGYPNESLTGAQEATLANLYRWGRLKYGWPLQLAEAPGQRGFGWHGMGGTAWGGHVGCPGNLRKARRQPILTAAAGGQPPAPPPPQGDDDLTPEQDRILKDIQGQVAGTGPMNEILVGLLRDIQRRLQAGEPKLEPTGFGALGTLDQGHRDLWNKLIALEQKVDRLAK